MNAEMTVDLTGAGAAGITIDLTGAGAASVAANFVGSKMESAPIVVVQASVDFPVTTKQIMNQTNKKTLMRSLESEVPDGYRCIGRQNVHLTHVSSSSYYVRSGASANNIIFYALGVVNATGESATSPSMPYYFTVNADLICLRNDLEVKEVG